MGLNPQRQVLLIGYGEDVTLLTVLIDRSLGVGSRVVFSDQHAVASSIGLDGRGDLEQAQRSNFSLGTFDSTVNTGNNSI